jgi:hypothetical protein
MLTSILDALTQRPLLGVVAVLISWRIWRLLVHQDPAPIVPWIGKQSKFASKVHTRISAFQNGASWLKDGYIKVSLALQWLQFEAPGVAVQFCDLKLTVAQYSKRGMSYKLPAEDGRIETVVPRSQIKWLLDHPE